MMRDHWFKSARQCRPLVNTIVVDVMGDVSILMQIQSAFARSKTWRFAISLCLAELVLAAMPLDFAHADKADDSLQVYAVTLVMRDARQSWTGSGIYLGNGMVITAAHVVGTAIFSKPSVRVAGLDLPTKVIKQGAPDQVDLTLLFVDKDKLPISLQMRRMPLCERPPWPGESVIVAAPQKIARSHIMSPQLLPPHLRTKYGTVISDVANTGNSGSGVFDAKRKCLLGIMTRKIQVRRNPGSKLRDLAKYFVPASTITAFIGTKNRF
jgi:hypothetical protein